MLSSSSVGHLKHALCCPGVSRETLNIPCSKQEQGTSWPTECSCSLLHKWQKCLQVRLACACPTVTCIPAAGTARNTCATLTGRMHELLHIFQVTSWQCCSSICIFRHCADSTASGSEVWLAKLTAMISRIAGPACYEMASLAPSNWQPGMDRHSVVAQGMRHKYCDPQGVLTQLTTTWKSWHGNGRPQPGN